MVGYFITVTMDPNIQQVAYMYLHFQSYCQLNRQINSLLTNRLTRKTGHKQSCSIKYLKQHHFDQLTLPLATEKQDVIS
mgnify:CR=1 FL=1